VSAPDNPQAFPYLDESCGLLALRQPGMTLRDYFAVHADQPGVSEIASAANMQSDGFHIWPANEPITEKQVFNVWWNLLPLGERLSLSAKVRFAMADAMLAERAKVKAAETEMQHVAYYDEGAFHWTSGIAPRDCELFAPKVNA